MQKKVRKAHSITALKSLVLGAFFVVIGGVKTHACSVYAPYQHAIMAANYDWTVSGGIIFTNARALDKTAFLVKPIAGKKPARWTSRYASLTLSQWGREFPMQGLNEAGLAGVVLNAPATYSLESTTHSIITEMQWLQYQLDRFSTLRDMESHIQDFGIQKISAALHFFFCDATTDCGLVEFVNGKAQMHRGARFPLRAITNSSYKTSFDVWTEFLKDHGNPPTSLPPSELPAGYESLHRVVRAASYAKARSSSDRQALLNLRDLAGHGWTNWHSIFKTSRQQILITPLKSATTYTIERKDFTQGCRQPAKTRLMNESLITPQWSLYNPKDAAALLALAAKPIGGFSRELQQRMIDYASTPLCTLGY